MHDLNLPIADKQAEAKTTSSEIFLMRLPPLTRLLFTLLVFISFACLQVTAEPPASPTVAADIAPGSVFTPPAENACQSNYDQFYESEPGVYGFWALCEPGQNPAIYDYVGKNDLYLRGAGWGSGAFAGGQPGPVRDGETAIQVSTAAAFRQNQGIPLNPHEGTIASWINANASQVQVTAVFFAAVHGSSVVSLSLNSEANNLCFSANYKNTTGGASTTKQCGVSADSWHRAVMTWSNGSLRLYLDGQLKGQTSYTGTLDNKVFFYKLFPGCCDTKKQMTLAKALISNRAWSATQVAADFAPKLISPPKGGLYITDERLGTIHRDVLGYADNNSDLSSPAVADPLVQGLRTGGFTSVRYGGGYGGISTDTANWRGGVSCTAKSGVTAAAANAPTENNIDNYFSKVVKPLGLHSGYTVNYGTNPPACNAGGDPIENGAKLVAYAKNKHYGIKYWEIGNEQYQGFQGGSEPDLHENPGTGASYAAHETAFYTAMKAEDSSIQIGVPYGEGIYKWEADFSLPVFAGASYDAAILHSYPIKRPISDGNTLYQDRVASNTVRIRATLLKLQTVLLSNNKSPDAIWVTEWNADVSGGEWSRQTMGAVMPMFGTIQLAEYMRAGVQYATWWTQGMSNSCYRIYYDGSGETAYNWADCGGVGLAYTGPLKAEIKVGLKPGDLTPIARAFQLLSESGFVAEGEHMLNVIPDVKGAPWLVGYAATHGRSYALILINRDRDQAHTVPVQFAGKQSGASVTQFTYGRAQYDKTRTGDWSQGPVSSKGGSWNGTFSAVLPPWSVNVIVLN